MIIRYGGGNSGIQEYLEEGRKVDRHFSRDEMDSRIIIDGDLDVTQGVIDLIPNKGQDRYLHISLSFNEPDVTEAGLKVVFEQYKQELFNAYDGDEFNIYAEIHWPKIKESYNHNTEKMEPRYPHIHVVVPKRNLLTGGHLNPIGIHQQSLKYLDAIQEKLNRANGLSSPRESPRVGSNHYEQALGKYKDKEFESKNGEVKKAIHANLIAGDIKDINDFKVMLSDYGDVKVRNAGTDRQYFAIKVEGDSKFTNLKGAIFTKEYIENRSLVLEPITDAQVSKRIQTWRDIQSREIKYISTASTKLKTEYRGLGLEGRREFLNKREAYYEQKNRPKSNTLPSVPAGYNKPSHIEFAGGIEAEAARDMRELRKSRVVYLPVAERARAEMLLQHNAGVHMDNIQSRGISGLRPDLYDRAGEGGESESRLNKNEAQELSQSSVVSTLMDVVRDDRQQENEFSDFALIRKTLKPESIIAYAQIHYGIDPAKHAITRARNGEARINCGKFNYNVSDFLTKHIGLEWKEAGPILKELYGQQLLGVDAQPKKQEEHVGVWREFREFVYPKNIKTYNELKSSIKSSSALQLKVINADFFSRRRAINQDVTLTSHQRHFMRSDALLVKLQKIEALQLGISENKEITARTKYPFSTLFADYSTKGEAINVKALDHLRKTYRNPSVSTENSIGHSRPLSLSQIPSSAEAIQRAKLIAKLQQANRKIGELKIKLNDLQPQPLKDGGVAFNHKQSGQLVFINHPDRVVLNKTTTPDEVGVALTFAIERFGSPLEINGTQEFKDQIVSMAAERDMDIKFTDPAMNKLLAAKRLELGMEPLSANSIEVPALKLDSSLPFAEAVDKALLDSKVAELTALNESWQQTSASNPELAPALAEQEQILVAALERHEEIHQGQVTPERAVEIAEQDLIDFKHHEGKPHQQQLALAMGGVLTDEAYRSHITEHGSSELFLTIEASQVIEQGRIELETSALTPGIDPFAAVPEVAAAPEYVADPSTKFESLSPADAAKEERKAADLNITPADIAAADAMEAEQAEYAAYMNSQAAELDKAPAAAAPSIQNPEFTHNGQPATLDLDAFKAPETAGFKWPEQRSEVRPEVAARVAELESIKEQFSGLDAYDDPSILVRTDVLRETENDLESVIHGDLPEDRVGQIARSSAQIYSMLEGKPEQQDIASLMGQAMQENAHYAKALEKVTPENLIVTIAAVTVIEERQMLAKEERKSFDMAQSDGVNAAEILDRRAVLAEEGLDITDLDSSSVAVNFAQKDAANYAALDQGNKDGFREATAIIAESIRDIPAYESAFNEHLSELSQAGFINELDTKEMLETISASTIAVEAAPVAATEPLTFVHEGQPVTLDLDRFKAPEAAPVEAAPVAATPAPTVEPLTFVHNGEPVTLDLERFKAPEAAPVEAAPVMDDRTQRELEKEWAVFVSADRAEQTKIEESGLSELKSALVEEKARIKVEYKANTPELSIKDRLSQAVGLQQPYKEDVRNKQVYEARVTSIDYALRDLNSTSVASGNARHVDKTLFGYGLRGDQTARDMVTEGLKKDKADIKNGEYKGVSREQWVKEQFVARSTPEGLQRISERKESLTSDVKDNLSADSRKSAQMLAAAIGGKENVGVTREGKVFSRLRYTHEGRSVNVTDAFKTSVSNDLVRLDNAKAAPTIERHKADQEIQNKEIAAMLAEMKVENMALSKHVAATPVEVVAATAINSRAEVYKDAVQEIGLEKANAEVTPEIAERWTARDAEDIGRINDVELKTYAAETIAENAANSPQYKKELEASQPELATRAVVTKPTITAFDGVAAKAQLEDNWKQAQLEKLGDKELTKDVIASLNAPVNYERDSWVNERIEGMEADHYQRELTGSNDAPEQVEHDEELV